MCLGYVSLDSSLVRARQQATTSKGSKGGSGFGAFPRRSTSSASSAPHLLSVSSYSKRLSAHGLAGAGGRCQRHGNMYRDFTYVEDPVRGIQLLMDAIPPAPDAGVDPMPGASLSSVAPFRVVNIRNAEKAKLLDFIDGLEATLGVSSIRNYMGIQLGDVPTTWADTRLLRTLTEFTPQTDFTQGTRKLVEWFRDYYGC